MNNTNQYCVTIKLYTWADNEQEAIDNVISELDYICEGDNNLAGFIYPNLADVVEDKDA